MIQPEPVVPDSVDSLLADLHTLDLDAVTTLPDSVLGESPRRLVDEASRPDDAVARFQSNI